MKGISHVKVCFVEFVERYRSLRDAVHPVSDLEATRGYGRIRVVVVVGYCATVDTDRASRGNRLSRGGWDGHTISDLMVYS